MRGDDRRNPTLFQRVLQPVLDRVVQQRTQRERRHQFQYQVAAGEQWEATMARERRLLTASLYNRNSGRNYDTQRKQPRPRLTWTMHEPLPQAKVYEGVDIYLSQTFDERTPFDVGDRLVFNSAPMVEIAAMRHHDNTEGMTSFISVRVP